MRERRFKVCSMRSPVGAYRGGFRWCEQQWRLWRVAQGSPSRRSAVHLSSRTHRDPATLDAAIREVLVAAAVDVVFLAGYMKRLGPFVLGTFQGRILNTHPALLPRFGGRGMYGDRVFEAVLDAGEAESGVSIHLVDREYDTGPIVRQCKVPVLRDDSVDDLKARVRAR